MAFVHSSLTQCEAFAGFDHTKSSVLHHSKASLMRSGVIDPHFGAGVG
jgi:hypothetical protein